MSRASLVTGATLILLMTGVVALQAARERTGAFGLPEASVENLLYMRSSEGMKRAALSYRAAAADVYWIRAVQHFGSTKLFNDAGERRQYDLLYPLIDISTTLDPQFTLAYRLGAILLAEPYPEGPGRTDLAIALLHKGLAAQPDRWEFAQDIGFVHYWWRRDYVTAAEWLRRAASFPDAPNWLNAVAAVTLAEGGNRESSRRLWQELMNTDAEYLRNNARFRLAQLDALDQIDALQRAVRAFASRAGRQPQSWVELQAAGYVTGVPRDPTGHQYQLDPRTGAVTLAAQSGLHPMPISEQTTVR